MTKILGIGIDVVDVARFRSQINKQPALLTRLLTDTEIAESGERDNKLAGKFAAKEAFIKAVGGMKNFGFQDMEIASKGEKPFFIFSGNCQKLISELKAKAHLSITHDGGIAIAYVILEQAGDES